MDDSVNNTKVMVKSVDNVADRDPVPEQFDSIEDMAEFWDTHDTADYEDCFSEPIPLEIELDSREAHLFAIDKELVKRLRPLALQRGVSLETLINLWLHEKLIQKNTAVGYHTIAESTEQS